MQLGAKQGKSTKTLAVELAAQAKKGNNMLELYQIMAIIQEQFRIILRFVE